MATGSTPPGLVLANGFTVRWMPELATGWLVASGPSGLGMMVRYTMIVAFQNRLDGPGLFDRLTRCKRLNRLRPLRRPVLRVHRISFARLDDVHRHVQRGRLRRTIIGYHRIEPNLVARIDRLVVQVDGYLQVLPIALAGADCTSHRQRYAKAGPSRWRLANASHGTPLLGGIKRGIPPSRPRRGAAYKKSNPRMATADRGGATR